MTCKNKILIVGASGYIGRAIVANKPASAMVVGTSTTGEAGTIRLLLNAPEAFDYDFLCPGDTVMLAAAISAPDVCVREYDRAWGVNVRGTAVFIERAIGKGARVVFFSSDTVYGEKQEPFDEAATVDPVGEYASMKREVECRFADSPLFKAIRLSYVFSRQDKFTKYLGICAEKQESAEVFDPFHRAVIHREDVALGLMELADRWDEFPQKVINFGGGELLSRVDFASTLRTIAYPDLKFTITAPGEDFFKGRPRVINMKSPILPALLGRPMRKLREAAAIEFNSGVN